MAKKILIIEADPTALRLTEYTLKQRGHQVLTTCNGLEGIITAQKEAPDLIILGAIPIIILAIIVDAFMRAIMNVATPKGLERKT
jgi:CheY-like chemotaxis protein